MEKFTLNNEETADNIFKAIVKENEKRIKKNNDKILELMVKKGVDSIYDIESIIKDSDGNVIDIRVKEKSTIPNQMRISAGFDPVDNVNHPSHYKAKNGMEVIDVIEAFTANLKGYEASHTANVIKYICRWKEKNGLEDLKKAQWYLDRLIKNIEGNK